MVWREARTDEARALHASDPAICVWWATRTECASVLARLFREGRLSESEATVLRDRLSRLFKDFQEIDPSESLRLRAERLLSVHPLRTADALQLAAALMWTDERPSQRPLVSLDRRLREAAQKEGFTLLPVGL